MKLTLYKYIFLEIWPTFLASLLVFVFVIMGSKMLWVTEMIIKEGAYPGHVLKIMFYLLPRIIIFSLPATTLMCMLLNFLRMSSDNEIMALKASGISLYQLLPPVFFFSLMCYLMASLIAIFWVPWGNRSYHDVIFQIAESKADIGIKERSFCEPFDNLVFYVNSFSARERAMMDIFMVDRRDTSITNTIVARKGKILSNLKSRIITLHLMDGTIFMVDKKLQSARTIRFATYDLNIDLKDIMSGLASREKRSEEKSIRELIQDLKLAPKGELKYNEMKIKLFEMFSIPIAVFFMGIMGLPLGALGRPWGRSIGIFVSLLIFLIYYASLAGVRTLCKAATVSPAIGVWIPDFFLFVSFIYLLRWAASDRPINFLPETLLKLKSLYRVLVRCGY